MTKEGENLVVQDPQVLAPEEQFKDAFGELVALERQRIDSTNRRTDIALKAIEVSDAADKRQYDYHVERLRKNSTERSDKRRATLRMMWAGGVSASLLIAFIMLMLFFGADAQRDTALTLLRTVSTAVGGAGIVWLLKSLFERLMRDGPAT